eukprot:PhM_4_TR8330/c0_g1_i1/m.73207
MLFLFVSLEFHSSTLFSGNGTYGRSLVASMAAMGHNVQVVCAIPSSSSTLTSQSCTVMGDTEILNQSNIATNDDDGETDAPPSGSICGTVSLFGVDVPERKWKRVDRLSAWREWTEAFAECTTQFLDFASNPPDALFFRRLVVPTRRRASTIFLKAKWSPTEEGGIFELSCLFSWRRTELG